MTATGISRQSAKKRFDFLHTAVASMPLRVNDTTAFVDAFNGGNLQITLGGAATGNGSVDMEGNGFRVEDLLAFEALIKLDSIDTNANFRIGMAGAFNADPDVIAQCAWFNIDGTGASNAHTVTVETDDGTTNIDDEPTSKTLKIGAWSRLRIDFKTGIQTISPPGTSKGGLGSVRFYMPRTSQDNHFMDLVTTTKHMDMAAVAGSVVLQPMVHGVQAVTTGTTVLQIRELCVEYLLNP